MELRSVEIRSHIVIRRTSRVYSLCVFRLLQHRHPDRDRIISTSSPPSSFTVVPPAPNQSSSHVVFKSSLHVVFWILVTCCIRILVTCCIRILVTCLFESSLHVILESIINHIHKTSVMTGNSHNIFVVYKCRITSHRMPDSTVKSSKDIWEVTIALSSRAIVPGNGRDFS